MKKFFYMIILYFLILLIPGCTFNRESKQVAAVRSSENASQNNQIPVLYEDYKEATAEQIKLIDRELISKTVTEKDVNDINISIVEMADDKEYYHSAAETDNKMYDLGQVSLKNLSDLNTDLVTINTSKFCNLELIRIDGILGADYPQSSYYMINKNTPSLFLKLGGHIEETDIDGDNSNEIIVSIGTPTITQILKCEGAQIKIADVNNILNNALSVIYEKNYFVAYYKDQPNKPQYFKYNKIGFKLELEK